MKYIFNSELGVYIEGLIKQKNSVGYPYLESKRILKNFDTFCLMNFPKENFLSAKIGKHWAVVSPTESADTFQNRMAPVRELARYIQRLGLEAYIIPKEVGPKCSHKKKKPPHIFTDKELKLFFSAVDSLEINKRCSLRHLALPVIFRMLYCCGLRPHEARIIETADINLNTGKLQIRESKGHKDRIVIMPQDLLEICQNYSILLQETCPESKYFFPSQLEHLNPYTGIGFAKLFRKCWESAGIGTYGGDSPRPYSFRHTFATRRLYQWMKEDKDIESMIPYLSAYMGHERFSDTAYYIHLVPEIFTHMSQMDFASYEKLLPEVSL